MKQKIYTEFLSGNPKGRHHLEEISVNERMILKWGLMK